MPKTRTTIYLVGGLELSITDNTEPSDAEFQIITNEIMKSLGGGVHIMDNSDVAGTYVDGKRVLRRYLLAHGDYITGAIVEEVE